jgi:hypothetical protein
MATKHFRLLPLLVLVACGGRSVLDGGSIDAEPPATPSDFVGTWTCTGTSSVEVTGVSWPITMVATFVETLDGSLSMDFRTIEESGQALDGGVDPTSPFTFTIWGHTAIGTRSQTVTEGAGTFSFVSASFEVNGTKGTIALTERVTGAPGSGLVNSTDTIAASCVKNP